MVVSLGRNRALSGRVPDHHVGVAAHRNHSLTGVHAKDLGSVCADGGHELRGREDASGDTFVPGHGHAVLDAVDTVGDLGEIVLAHRLLVSVEGAVVRAHSVQVAGGQQLHEVCLDGGIFAERGPHHVGCRVAPVLVPAVRSIDAKTRGNGLAEDLLAGGAGFDDLVGCGPAHHVDNVDGSVHAVSNHNGTVGRLALNILRTSHAVPLGTCDAHFQHLPLALTDQITVLGMHLSQCADLLAASEAIVKLHVVELEDVLVSKETLE
mmetsp:Transcript_5954/g.13538  ORF Transcript_5954/g.13538 Transcript_5954/m.13538 type:complete len:265 (+) Transcript_5954:595-1389(+)